MNSRSISSFCVSFALLVAALLGSAPSAAKAAEQASFAASLSSQRSSSVDAGRLAYADTQRGAGESASATAGNFVLSKDMLLSSLREQLSSHYNLEGDLQIDLLRPWTEPTAVRDPIVVSVLEFPPQLASSTMVRFRAEAGGVVVADTTVSLRVQLLRDAWVSRQPIARDSIFDSSVLDVRRVDVLRERDVLPSTVGDRSMSFTRPVSAGRVLCWRDVARRPLVRKGDLVDVVASEGMLSVNMRGLALQSGAAGDVITVRNLESKREISAQVVSENRAQVRF